MLNFGCVITVPGLECATIIPHISNHTPTAAFPPQLWIIFGLDNAYFSQVVRIGDFGSLSDFIYDVLDYPTRRNFTTSFLYCLLPYLLLLLRLTKAEL